MQPTLFDAEPTDAELLAALERGIAAGEFVRFPYGYTDIHRYTTPMRGLDTGTCADCGMDKAAH